jgi:CelD/BcsL family acetyltransferase involved in cellulose biosynthesis
MSARTLRIVRTIRELADLRGAWTTLMARGGIESPFLTWEWMYSWWEQYCAVDTERRLATVVAEQDGEVVGILPGYLRPASTLGVGLTEYAFLGTEYESTDYLQVIEADGAQTLLPAMLEALLRQEPSVDVVILEDVLESHALLATLREVASDGGFSFETEPHRTCPFIAVGGEWEDYLGTLSAKMRKNVRRATRQLLDAGAEFTLVDRADEVPSAVRDLFDLHARRFDSKEEITGFSSDREPFHVAVSRRFLERDVLRLFRVRAGGRTIAALYCFEIANGLYYFQSGLDPAWEKLSAGTALVGHAIKHAFDHRLALFDFMRGGEEYKFRWTSTVREIVVARVGTSWKGRAALTMRRHGLRAKRIAKRIIRPEPKPAPPAEVPVS